MEVSTGNLEMTKVPTEEDDLHLVSGNHYEKVSQKDKTHALSSLESNNRLTTDNNPNVGKNKVVINKWQYRLLLAFSIVLLLLLFYLGLEEYKRRFSDYLLSELINNNVVNDPEKYKQLQEKIKIFLCVPVKNENRYLREYAAYYFGVHKINKMIIYDNNDVNGEHVETVLQDYIDEGLVEVVDIRGKHPGQKAILNECYHKNKKKYDWMMIYDADEFLTLNFNLDIRTILDSEYVKKNKCGCVTANWLSYGDSDLTYFDNRTIRERFIKPLYPYDYTRPNDGRTPNINTKSIIKCGDWKDMGGNSDLAYMGAHTPDYTKLCNLLGQGWPLFNPRGMYFNVGHVAHYCTKTAEEFIGKIARADISMKKGYNKEQIKQQVQDYFFGMSKVTEEKIKIFEKGFGMKFEDLYGKEGKIYKK